MEADVAINKDVVNLEGDVIEITSLKPLLSKNGIGRISFWSKSKQEGAIENHIYFSKLCCEFVYEPNLGDEVEYNAIESDQGKNSNSLNTAN